MLYTLITIFNILTFYKTIIIGLKAGAYG